MSIDRRECFNCVHWVPEAAEGWVPGFDGDTFGHYDLRVHLRKNKLAISTAGWKGHCHRDPVAVDARSVHRCGSWVCDANNNWLGVETSATFTHEVTLRAEVDELSEKLKAERKRSLERYRKLQVKAAKPKAKSNGAAHAAGDLV